MNKDNIKSPFVKVLVTVDSSKGSDQSNLFEVDLGPKTTWDYLNELMTKCDLYLITPETPETPSRALKITSFAPNTVGEEKLYKVKVESTDSYRTDILHKAPENIKDSMFKIFRTFRFIDVTKYVQDTLQVEGSATEGNYKGFEYVKIEPESEAKEALVTRGTTVLQALKDKVNELFTGQRIKVGKLLAQRKEDSAIFDALFDFNNTALVFDIKPIGLKRMVEDAAKNVEQGINAGVDAARVGISNAASLSPELVDLNTQVQTAKLAQVDTENQQEGYYKDVDPAKLFDQFRLLIRNDDNLFGGKHRTRRSKKSQKNKRKNKKTNKRRRR